jgi:hypothetical protein
MRYGDSRGAWASDGLTHFYFGLVPQCRERNRLPAGAAQQAALLVQARIVIRGILAARAQNQHTRRSASPSRAASTGMRRATSSCSAP